MVFNKSRSSTKYNKETKNSTNTTFCLCTLMFQKELEILQNETL